jgi:hypothetical protein
VAERGVFALRSMLMVLPGLSVSVEPSVSLSTTCPVFPVPIS